MKKNTIIFCLYRLRLPSIAENAGSADVLLKGKFLTNDTTFKAAGIFPGDTIQYSVMPKDDILLVVSAATNRQPLERRVVHILDHLGIKYGLIFGNMPAYKPTLSDLFKKSGLSHRIYAQ